MFRWARQRLHAYRERIRAALLLPVFIVGSLPHAVCVCARSDRDRACPAMVCRFAVQPVRSALAVEQPGKQAAVPVRSRTCCRQQKPKGESESVPAAGIVAQRTGCCQWLIAVPAAARPGGHFVAQLPQPEVSYAAYALPLAALGSAGQSIGRNSSAVPIPIDAVIVLQRLTI
jgi:hypothetical protein